MTNRKRCRKILELSYSSSEEPNVKNENNQSPKSSTLLRKVFKRIPVVRSENICVSPSTGHSYQELTNVLTSPRVQNCTSCSTDQNAGNSNLFTSNLPSISKQESSEFVSPCTTNTDYDGMDLRTKKIKILEEIIIPAPKTKTISIDTSMGNNDTLPLMPLNGGNSTYGSLSNISVSNMLTLDESFDEQKISDLLNTPKHNNRIHKEKLSSHLNLDETPENLQLDLSAPGPSRIPLDMDKAIKAHCTSTSNIIVKDNERITSTSLNSTHENDPVIDSDDDSSYAPSASSDSESDISVITTEDECDGDRHNQLDNGTPPNITIQRENVAEDSNGDEWVDIEDTTPEFEEYSHECQYNVPENVNTPDEIFRLFLTDEIVDKMVLETNLYAEKFLSNPGLKKKSRFRYWKPINRDELLKFLGVALVMGLNKVPHINDYWSQNIMYRNEYIIKVMSRDRFTAILKFWHFSDDTIDRTTDKLNKIRDVYEMLLTNFKKVIVPGKILVIDETMVPWRGRLQFRQYIKNKTHKYGVKLYKLCTIDGFTCNMIVYTGKGQDGREKDHGMKTVLKLLQNLDNNGRIIITDNFYNSVELAEELLKRKTFLCGTLRANRKGLPKSIVAKKIKKGEVIGKMRRTGVKVIKWVDKRAVLMITSCKNHDAKLITKTRFRRCREEHIRKPECIFFYNDGKKGIDYSDQMSSYYSPLKRGKKWFRKLMMELIFGTAIVNAWVVYNNKKKKKLPKKNFIESIITKFTGVPFFLEKDNPEVTTEHKYIVNTKKRRCVSCYEKARKTMTSKEADKKKKQVKGFCVKCEKTMCLPCFNEKH
ncbi:hypothetical protein B5X24_HaOG202873 [Helicoverpa armigera]|nr:hypothetical protein B5X24_HaOG202873 [Helicoverpa armigera]